VGEYHTSSSHRKSLRVRTCDGPSESSRATMPQVNSAARPPKTGQPSLVRQQASTMPRLRTQGLGTTVFSDAWPRDSLALPPPILQVLTGPNSFSCLGRSHCKAHLNRTTAHMVGSTCASLLFVVAILSTSFIQSSAFLVQLTSVVRLRAVSTACPPAAARSRSQHEGVKCSAEPMGRREALGTFGVAAGLIVGADSQSVLAYCPPNCTGLPTPVEKPVESKKEVRGHLCIPSTHTSCR
jgi:hypothetical protein